MLYRRLGHSDLDVSVIGLGCWALGGHGWGRVDDRKSTEAVRAALEAGVNFFDTADIYGFGHSEELLGKSLKNSPEALVATKVGLRRDESGRVLHDLGQAHIRSACDASLRRLRRDHIDVYLLHWPDPKRAISEVLETMRELVDAGKVRYLGAANLSPVELAEVAKMPEFVVYQGCLNALQPQESTTTLPLCRREDVGFIAYEPLLKGILTGKYRSKPEFGRQDHRYRHSAFGGDFEGLNEAAERVAEAARAGGVDPAALALAIVLAEADIAIPGAKTAAQVKINVGAAEIDASLVASGRAALADPAMR